MEVLTDIQIMEAGHQLNYQYRKLPDTVWGANYEKIFAKHKITRKEFVEAYTFYRKRPESFSKIWEKVINKLQSKEADLQRKK